MNKTHLIDSLSNIRSVTVDSNELELLVSNECSFQAHFAIDKVVDYDYVVSPYNEECLKIDFANGSFLIVAPNDFVFEVLNQGVFQVQDMPPIISINEMLRAVEGYIENPEPTNNMDSTLGLYLLNRNLLRSAKAKGFSVDDLLQEVEKAALTTSAISDTSLYD